MIVFIEWAAGKLMVLAGHLRYRRGATNDPHEVRHLYAALRAGNSDPCGPNGANCHLDQAALIEYMDYIQRVHDSAVGVAPEPSEDAP